MAVSSDPAIAAPEATPRRGRRRSVASFAVFLAVISLVLTGVHYYLWQRLAAAPAWEPGVVRAAGWLAAGLALATPVGIALGRRLPRSVGRGAGWLAYVWFGTMWLLLGGTLATELVRIVGFAARTAGAAVPAGVALDRPLAQAVLGWAALGLLWGLWSASGRVPVRRVRVELPRLPEALDGFRLVQLSDLHIGPTLGRAWLEGVVAQVGELDADAVAITGDLVDAPVDRIRDAVAPLADLKSRYGTFFVTGNHEYYSGADSWIEALRGWGIRVLRNERVAVGPSEAESLDLAGVDDFNAFGVGHGPDLGKALRGRDRAREVVLLAHQPRQIQEAAEHGVGLQLSGHTHGGQIAPWHLFVRLQQPFVAGLVRVGPTQLYVSRGTGYWGPPMRVLAPAEITLLELRRGPG